MEDGFSLGGPQGGTSYNQGIKAILESGVDAAEGANNQLFFFSDGEPIGANPLPTQAQIDALQALGFDIATIGISLGAGDGSALADLADRKNGVCGKSVSVRVDLGGRRYLKKKK